MDDPGPGAYENNKSTLNTSSSGHVSSFKSGSQRGCRRGRLGRPSGSYDPYTVTDLASTSKKSFGKSNRTGADDFGGMDRRELKVEVMGESTPGPGAYNGDVMMRNGKRVAPPRSGEKMPSSAFKSTTSVVKYADLHVATGAGDTPRPDDGQPHDDQLGSMRRAAARSARPRTSTPIASVVKQGLSAGGIGVVFLEDAVPRNSESGQHGHGQRLQARTWTR